MTLNDEVKINIIENGFSLTYQSWSTYAYKTKYFKSIIEITDFLVDYWKHEIERFS